MARYRCSMLEGGRDSRRLKGCGGETRGLEELSGACTLVSAVSV